MLKVFPQKKKFLFPIVPRTKGYRTITEKYFTFDAPATMNLSSLAPNLLENSVIASMALTAALVIGKRNKIVGSSGFLKNVFLIIKKV
jgi:hypothetical protein